MFVTTSSTLTGVPEISFPSKRSILFPLDITLFNYDSISAMDFPNSLSTKLSTSVVNRVGISVQEAVHSYRLNRSTNKMSKEIFFLLTRMYF